MRTTTFSNIGTDVKGLKTSEEVLNASGLNYDVIKIPIIYQGLNGEYLEYPDKVLTMNKTSGKIYNAVSKGYEICSNRDAFSLTDYIGQDDESFEYIKAGETINGLVYIIARIQNVNILGDMITPYIIFQNSYDGLNSLKATICPLRHVCQNQFNVSFRESANTVRIIHSAKMEERMLSARTMMRDIANYMRTFEATAETLATKRISYEEVVSIFNEVFKYNPEKMSSKQMQNFDDARNEFLACYNSDDNQNFKGFAWGVMNGAADYLTHHKSVRKSHPDSIFVNTTLLATTLNQILNRVSV